MIFSTSSMAPQSRRAVLIMSTCCESSPRITEQLVREITTGGGQPGAGERNEHSALALAKIVARGLAGDLGISEDAEQIVPELVRNSEG